jgi:hypothetical protein
VVLGGAEAAVRQRRGGHVSGVFLYVAIVAIWAFVLVPRWLRRHHAHQQPDSGELETADSIDPAAAEDDEQYVSVATAEAYTDADSEPEAAYDDDYESPAARTPPPAAARPRRSQLPPSRARMRQARRRLLTGLVLLAAAGAGCTAVKLTPWWACIPPAATLAGYLLLLREVGRAESDQARQREAAEARIRMARAQTARRRGEAEAAAAAQPSAQIIDISGRIGDQLYDQYADAAVRAVGD